MKEWKETYDNIEVPDSLADKIEQSVELAKEEKRRKKANKKYYTMGSVAAAVAILLILPNTSQTVAAAMYDIPVVGKLFQVVTVREYQVEEERHMADVKVVQIQVEGEQEETKQPPATLPQADEEGQPQIEGKTGQSEQLEQTVAEINFDIEETTNQLIEEFKANAEEFEEGYQDLYIDSKVLTDNERWFSLELILYQGAGSGYERHKHYTIDKTTGKKATLADFYEDDYIHVISEEIKSQMRSQMEADENVYYWVDDEEIPEWNFDKIAPDQDFYLNPEGNVVVCFDEYEVAPGYMGCVEFVLPQQ